MENKTEQHEEQEPVAILLEGKIYFPGENPPVDKPYMLNGNIAIIDTKKLDDGGRRIFEHYTTPEESKKENEFIPPSAKRKVTK